MPGITLSGPDQRTNIDDLKALAGAEIGVLLTITPEGRNRYMPLHVISKLVKALSGRVAIHICGGKALAGLLRGNLDWIVDDVARIQVNGVLSPDVLRKVCVAYPKKTIITQHKEKNSCLVEVDLPNHALLVDASGGEGKLPSSWTRPATEKPVGFAGGLGPGNMHEELPKIRAVATGDWWIDMEGKLRTDDWFDIQKARQVMAWWKFLMEKANA